MKILVVDDEPLIAKLVARWARACKFDPTTVHDGTEAWRLIEAAPSAWDTIITDIRMPRLDGVSLVRRLRASGNFVPAVFISGHSASPDLDALAPARFLAKPFAQVQLRNAVRELTSIRTGTRGALTGEDVTHSLAIPRPAPDNDR